MKKSLIFNLGGNVCYIDEDAVEVLQTYLAELRAHFGETPSTDEVMNDIEARLWEIFSERRRYGMQSATLQDVNEAIAILGRVEDFGVIADDEPQHDAESPNADIETPDEPVEQAPKCTPFYKRKLYRDKQNSVFGGVASGLGAFFGIHEMWIRLAFVLLFFCYGSAAVIYLVMWAIVPKAATTAQRLEMQGIEPSVENIHRYVTGQGSGDAGVPQREYRGGCLQFMALGCGGVIFLYALSLLFIVVMSILFFGFEFPGDFSGLSSVSFAKWNAISYVISKIIMCFLLVVLLGLPVVWIYKFVKNKPARVSVKTTIIYLIVWLAAFFALNFGFMMSAV